MSTVEKKPQISPVRNVLSILLFVLAGVLLATAGYLFWEDRNQDSPPPAPTSVPGHAQLNTVHDALASQGLDVEYGKQTVRVDGITPVGQELIVNGQSAYVFIFSGGLEQQEAEMSGVDADSPEVTDAFGDAATLSVSSGSNVAVILTGGDEDLAQSVADAVATVP